MGRAHRASISPTANTARLVELRRSFVPFRLIWCRISRLWTRRFPEFGTTSRGTPAESSIECYASLEFVTITSNRYWCATFRMLATLVVEFKINLAGCRLATICTQY